MKFSHTRLLAVAFAACSCSGGHGGGPVHEPATVREYKIMVLHPQSITLTRDYPAIAQGQQTVEIRPRVTGYIEEVSADEGDYVKKGQTLFRLNADDLTASVRSAEAQVKVAEAEVGAAIIDLDKTRPLVEKGIISRFDLETVRSALAVKEALLAHAKAGLDNARAQLSYAIIVSPVDGVMGTFPYRAGSLVSSTTTMPLTTVSNTSHMYAYFSVNEKDFLTLIKGAPGNTINEKLENMPDISFVLADNTTYLHEGRLEAASGIVDTQTGAITIRAGFPNPEGLLRSGANGAVRIPQHLDSVIVIPQRATFDIQNKHFAWVVDHEQKVHSTSIDVEKGSLKDSYVVVSGLKNGDRIVAEAIGSLRDNMTIKPSVDNP